MNASEDALSILALSEARLLERVVDLTLERDRYRELAQQSLHALHDLQQRYDRLQERYSALVEEQRRYVAAVVAERAA